MAALLNRTKAAMLGREVELADSAWARFRGLMLRRELGEGRALIIRPCGSIHMMFMRFPIDAVFFDQSGQVVKVARGLRPWLGLAAARGKGLAVAELPAGAAGPTEVGDGLEIVG